MHGHQATHPPSVLLRRLDHGTTCPQRGWWKIERPWGGGGGLGKRAPKGWLAGNHFHLYPTHHRSLQRETAGPAQCAKRWLGTVVKRPTPNPWVLGTSVRQHVPLARPGPHCSRCSAVRQSHAAESIMQLSFVAQLFVGGPCVSATFYDYPHPCTARRPLLKGGHSGGHRGGGTPPSSYAVRPF